MHAKHVYYVVRGTAGMTIKMVRRMTTGSELIIFFYYKPNIPYSMARGRRGGGEWGEGVMV